MATQLACDLCSSQSLSWSELRVHSLPSHAIGDRGTYVSPWVLLTISCPKQEACGTASPELQLPGPKASLILATDAERRGSHWLQLLLCL